MKCEPAVWEALADQWPRIMKLLRAPEAPAGEWLVRTAQELSTVLEYASLWDMVWFSNEEEEAVIFLKTFFKNSTFYKTIF